MALISTDAVRRAVGRLDDERAVDFVAALFDARGATTSVDYERNRVSVAFGGREETFRVCTGRKIANTNSNEDTSRVVLTRPASAVQGAGTHRHVIDPAGLRSMLVYGVPRASASALCRQFLGQPLVSSSPENQPVVSRLHDGSATALVVGLVGFVLVVASITGGVSLAGSDGALQFGAPASPGGASETPAATEAPTADTDAPSVDGPTDVTPNRLPPGLRANGSIDEDALADAHAKAVTGQSYRWTLTYREFVDGRETGLSREVVSVESPTVYRTDRSQYGRITQTSLALSNVEAYANGTTRFERRVLDDGFDRAPPRPQAVRGVRNGEERYADRAEQYIQWYLSVSESRLVDVVEVDGVQMYWISLGADPYPGVENSSGSALVDERGIVHEVRRSYDVPRTDGLSAVMTFRYIDFGATTVTPPAWHDSGGDAPSSTPIATVTTNGTVSPSPTSNTTTVTSTPTATETTF